MILSPTILKYKYGYAENTASSFSALACIQQQDSGAGTGGSGFSTRYFFNSVTENCETFTFYGSGGNANNFESLEQCESYCKDS